VRELVGGLYRSNPTANKVKKREEIVKLVALVKYLKNANTLVHGGVGIFAKEKLEKFWRNLS
jgi:hypothetical protein